MQKTKDRRTRTPLKTGDELRCPGRVSSSCSNSDTHRVLLQYIKCFLLTVDMNSCKHQNHCKQQDQLYSHGYCPREDCNRGHYLYHTEVSHMIYIKCYVDIRFDYKMRLNGNILSDKQCKEQVDKNNRYLFDVMP